MKWITIYIRYQFQIVSFYSHFVLPEGVDESMEVVESSNDESIRDCVEVDGEEGRVEGREESREEGREEGLEEGREEDSRTVGVETSQQPPLVKFLVHLLCGCVSSGNCTPGSRSYTLTSSMLGQALFASTSSYSSFVQRLPV